MLQKIKLLLGISDTTKDNILNLLIDRAKEFAISFTHNDDIEDDCENTILALVIWDYNRLDNIGVDSEDYSGVSFNYSTDYPEPLLKTLKAHRKAVIL